MSIRLNPSALPNASARSTFGSWLAKPLIATLAVITYIVIATLLVTQLDRTQLWYPLMSMCVFPLFVLAPMLVLVSPIPSRLKISLILVILIIVMPIVGIFNGSYLELAIQICIFAGLALGLNVVVGFAGLLDLGYVAFFAVGAYLWGMFTSQADTIFQVNGLLVPGWAFFGFVILGLFAAAVVGILLGLPVLRVRGDYLAIVTLGFGEVIRILARNGDAPVNFTNGSQGLHAIGRPTPLPFGIEFTQSLGERFGITINNPDTVAQQLLFYFISIVILGFILVAVRHLRDSAIGRAWYAIREDEVAAIAMGVPLVRMKLLAFATGASFGGAIGVLYAAKQTFIDPDSFLLLQSISVLAMVIVGGLGSIRGVLVGAAVVTLIDLHVLSNLSLQLNALRNADFIIPLLNFPINDWPSQLDPAKYQPLVFGLLLVLMMLFRPAGLVPEERLRMELETETEDDEPNVVSPPGAREPSAAIGD